MAEETRKQVFISYSRRNEYFAKQLDCDLRRMGLSPWRDKRSTEVNSIWRAEITKGIQPSDAFLLLLSPDAAESDYVQQEWEIACECLPSDRMAILKICHFASVTNAESDWVTKLNERQHIGFVGDYWSDHDDESGMRKLTAWLGQERIRSSTELLSDDSIAVADLVTEFRNNVGRSWPISRGDERLRFVAVPLSPSAHAMSWLVTERGQQSRSETDLMVVFQFTAEADRNTVDHVLKYWSHGGIPELSDTTPDLLLLDGPHKNLHYRIDDDREHVWADCIEHCVKSIMARGGRRTLHLFMNAPQALTYPVAAHLGTMNPLRIYNLQRGPVGRSETYRCVYRTNQA